tara:strand:+ start:220 stop:1278 length:1059 start_codon:yes stop_codon:yes gene_type:complete
MNERTEDALQLLTDLIRIPSFSKEEDKTAQIIGTFLEKKGVKFERSNNNLISRNKFFDESKYTVVLNSHHDTVKVVDGWTRDPFGAEVENEKLFGLGSNDAGGCLVSLIATYIFFYDKPLDYNLILIASAEEENFGHNGVSSVLSKLDIEPDLGIIGEPTQMQMAVAEKGLIVIDGLAKGESGHVAYQKGENAIYKAMDDIKWISNYQFPKVSETLGKVMMSATQVEGGIQHNVIPDSCKFVVDVRVNDCYRLKEVADIISINCSSEMTPRSLKWHPSRIDINHPLVKKGKSLDLDYYGSSTMSDQVHFKCPTLKIGPGDSLRSHTADEYILKGEVEQGISTYISLLEGLSL